MAWIYIEKDKDEMRSQMRRNMRGRWHFNGGGVTGDDDKVREAYREGYRHGWEDSEDESAENMRRSRDSRGRYE